MFLRFAKRLKLNYLLIVGLCAMPTLAQAQQDVATVIKEEVAKILNFWKTSIENRNQAEAELFSKEAPGTADAALRSAQVLRAVTDRQTALQADAEVDAINFDLYGQALPIDFPPGAGALPILPPIGNPTNYILKSHIGKFCSSQSFEVNFKGQGDLPKCGEAVGGTGGVPLALQHADLKLSTLLGPDVYPAGSESFALNLIRMLTGPSSSDKVRQLVEKPENLTKPKDKQLYADALFASAINSAARYSLLKNAFDRTPVQVGTQQNDNGQTVPVVKSSKQILREEATRRYGSKQWYDSVAQGSVESLLREIAHMMAYQIYVDMLNADRMERMETLQAVSLSRELNEAIAAYEALNPEEQE